MRKCLALFDCLGDVWCGVVVVGGMEMSVTFSATPSDRRSAVLHSFYS
jgi:hypothetical protein